MSRASLALVVPLAAAWAASCALSGFERGEEGLTQGGSGGAGGAGGSGGGTCAHAVAPAKPTIMSAGGTETVEVAVRSVDMAESTAQTSEEIGVDLDRFCTCQGEGPSCAGAVDNCDLADGRDNALRTLIQLIAPLFIPDTPSSFYSAQAEGGAWTLILAVTGYNGQPDDDQVRLEWYVSTGLDNVDPMATPAWDGSDPWLISDTSYLPDMLGMPDPTMPKYVDDNAYVSGGTLVASLGSAQPEIAFAGSSSYFKLRLTGATVMARLEPSGAAWAMRDGLIAGRISEADLFEAIGSYRDGVITICTNGPLYPELKSALCTSRDIHAGVQGPAAPCDALSFGIGFSADPARRGMIVMSMPPTPVCAMGTDPTNDNCALGAGGAGGAGGGGGGSGGN